jgi:integrase
MNAIRPRHIESLLDTLSATKAPSTLRSLYAALRACLDGAVRDRVIASNPCLSVQRPRAGRPKARAYTVEEVRRLVVASEETPLNNFVLLDALTGLRRGELCGLRWGDIDFDAAELRVVRELVRDSSGLHIDDTKTSSARSVALPAAALAALRREKAQQARRRLLAGSAWIDSGYVFTTAQGGPLEPRNVSRKYARIAKLAGTTDSGMHALRHYAATVWLGSGKATVKDVAELLGHSSPLITLQVYAAAVPASQRAAVDEAARLLEGGGAE